MFMQAFALAAALTVANFIFQAVGAHDWGTALDRSFFQAIAVGLAAVMLKVSV